MPDGAAVDCWTLQNQHGMTAEILTYGATLRALRVPAAGGLRDVVLGFDGLDGYLEHHDTGMGSVIGRVGGRIGGASFTLDGTEHPISPSQAPNCLHGGFFGFHRRVWTARAHKSGALELTYVSPDGEEGFPGALTVTVTYTLTDDDALGISYFAKTDRPTLVNLTNHSYFNLSGEPDVGAHRVCIHADRFLPLGEGSIPTGETPDVTGTAFDLRAPKALRQGWESGDPQIAAGKGYDHCFVLGDAPYVAPREAAVVEAGGLRLTCEATQPGLVLYTANYLNGLPGKGGAVYDRRSALCLETQGWPDAANHPGFPSTELRPGETYRQMTLFRFEQG